MEIEYFAGNNEIKAMEIVMEFMPDKEHQRVPELTIRLLLMEKGFSPRLIGRALRTLSRGGVGIERRRDPYTGETNYRVVSLQELNQALEKFKKLLNR